MSSIPSAVLAVTRGLFSAQFLQALSLVVAEDPTQEVKESQREVVNGEPLPVSPVFSLPGIRGSSTSCLDSPRLFFTGSCQALGREDELLC